MAKESISKPKTGSAAAILHGKRGGTQFTTFTATRAGGMKETTYHYPPNTIGTKSSKTTKP